MGSGKNRVKKRRKRGQEGRTRGDTFSHENPQHAVHEYFDTKSKYEHCFLQNQENEI